MSKLPWMPFYGHDFFTDDAVKPLRMHQAGFYIYLLWHQWEHGSIPDFDECLHFPFVGNELYWSHRDGYEHGPAEELPVLESLRYVFKMFFIPHPTLKKCFINRRCAAIKAEQDEQRAKKQAGGKTRAFQMWPSTSRSSPSSTTTKTPTSSPVGNQSQSQKQRKKDPEKSVVHTVDKLRDRNGQGFEPMGSLSEAVMEMMPASVREELEPELVIQPDTD